jgi:replicative DNA helicase
MNIHGLKQKLKRARQMIKKLDERRERRSIEHIKDGMQNTKNKILRLREEKKKLRGKK